MPDLLPWGLDLILAIQRFHGPALDGLFRAISFLGEEEFYLVLLPFLLWCVDFRLGARLAVLFLLSSYFNTGLKDLFCQPRPFDLQPSLQLSFAEGYGLPSGHAQSSVVVWGSIAGWTRKPWSWAGAIVLMVLIGFSRVYLGVHFPTDVAAGWFIGAVLLGLYRAVGIRLERRLAGLSLGGQIMLALALPPVLLLAHPVKDTATAMAALAGIGVGLALAHQFVPFSAGGVWWQRALRFLVGGAVVLVLYLGLKAASPGEGSALYLPFRLLRYGAMGIWVSVGAPWLFRRLGLAAGGERRGE